MTDDNIIEGELAEKAPAIRQDERGVIQVDAGATVVFNPLDAPPAQFANQLQSRSENYNNLAMHLRAELVVGKDFGRIHLGKKTHKNASMQCAEPWNCTPEKKPHHWSPYTLFSPGADKVLGILGLAASYPDEQDYRRACLKGMRIEDVIIKASIDNGRGSVVSEGMGSASREQENNDLNRTIKKACKRARVDAVMRLPAISSLFEDDFLAEIARNAKNKNSTTRRARTVNAAKSWDTGADLEVCPIGKATNGKRWRDIDTDKLEWMAQHITDKPDITRAVVRELEKRGPSGHPPESDSTRTGPPPASTEQSSDDWLAEYEATGAVSFDGLEDPEEWATKDEATK